MLRAAVSAAARRRSSALAPLANVGSFVDRQQQGAHRHSFSSSSTTPPPPPPPPLMTNHPKRAEVASVLHARPWQRISVPSLISSITSTHKTVRIVDGVACPMASTVGPSESYDRDYHHLKSLCDHFIVAAPPHGATFFTTELGPLNLRWERHTEVVTYTFTRSLPRDDSAANSAELARPFDGENVATSLVPEQWLREMPGGVVCATHVALVPGVAADGWWNDHTDRNNNDDDGDDDAVEQHDAAERLLRRLKPCFNHSELITGCELDRGRFRAFSDWRVHGDGFGRIVIHHKPNDGRAFVSSAAGKATQRFLELDKYRMLSLMGLPFAQGLSRSVDRLNEELMEVMDEIGGGAAAATRVNTRTLTASIPAAAAAAAARSGAAGGGVDVTDGGVTGGDGDGDSNSGYVHDTSNVIRGEAAAAAAAAVEFSGHSPERQRELLSRLTSLAATAQKLSAIAHDRFAASAAYNDLVDDRIGFLNMEPIVAVPGMASFITSACHPARRTCAAVQRRLDKLATSAQLTAEIMQTSLTVEQHAQSNENLGQLKKTSQTQLTMQHNVEGLSAVALTYYSIGVLGYLAKALNQTWGLPVSTEVALGASIPLVWVAVSVAVQRMKSAAMEEGRH